MLPVRTAPTADVYKRQVLAVDDVELTKAYFDVSAFHNRLHKEVLAQATEQAALTPKQLYDAALPELIGLIEQSEIYPFLRDRDTCLLYTSHCQRRHPFNALCVHPGFL